MRVAILCPYSLSVPGGVQGQVLGLARALRAIGVDARVIGPTDGPPPEPGARAWRRVKLAEAEARGQCWRLNPARFVPSPLASPLQGPRGADWRRRGPRKGDQLATRRRQTIRCQAPL